MKTVLCYGDSNTFGHATVPRPDGRYGVDERWPGVLRKELGRDWLVIEEGLGGRTTVRDDPVEGAEKNGKTYLLPCLLSHRPIDIVVVMLGTNDLKARFNNSAWEIAQGIGVLVDMIRGSATGPNNRAPDVLVVCPPQTLAKFPLHADMFAGAAREVEGDGEALPRRRRVARRPLPRCRQGDEVEQGRRVPPRPGSACGDRQRGGEGDPLGRRLRAALFLPLLAGCG